MSISKSESIPFFFIIGRARSGTTLLRCLMDAHPQLNIPLECEFIIYLQPRYGKIKTWDEKDILAFYSDLIDFPKFDFWVVDQEKLKKDLLNCVGENSYERICRVVYLNYQSFFEKNELKMIGDKNPNYCLQTINLEKLFPEARFIHITRDYRAHIASMVRAKFESPIYSSLAFRWKFMNKAVDNHKKSNPAKFYTLRYEDLVSNPEKYLREICVFLGIDFSFEMLNYHSKLDQMLAIYPTDLIHLYHKSLLKPINAENLNAWQNELTRDQIKTCDIVVGSYAEECGYERVYKKRNLIYYTSCIPGIIFGRLYYVLLNLLDKIPLNLKRKILGLLAIIFQQDRTKYKRKELNHK
jgi:hypothetical protein